MAARPALLIPPRKRRRLIYNGDDDEAVHDEDVNNSQAVVKAAFDDEDEDGDVVSLEGESEDDDDDEDFMPDNAISEDIASELEELHEDLQDAKGGRLNTDDQSRSERPKRRRKRPGGLASLEHYDEDDWSSAGLYNNPLLDYYATDEPASSASNSQKHVGGIASNTLDAEIDSQRNRHNSRRRMPAENRRSVRFEDPETASPATVRRSQGTNHEDDSDHEQADDDLADEGSSQLTGVVNGPDDVLLGSSPDSSSTFSSFGSSSHDDDETSSSGSSSLGSGSDSVSEQLIGSGNQKEVHDSTETSEPTSSSIDTGTSSSSSSDDDSDSDEGSHTLVTGSIQDTVEKAIPDSQRKTLQSTIAPGKGKRATQKRNRRRRVHKALTYLKTSGCLPADASGTDLLQYRNTIKKPSASSEEGEVTKVPDSFDQNDTAVEARRRALLQTVSSGSTKESSAKDIDNAKDDSSVTFPDDHDSKHFEVSKSIESANHLENIERTELTNQDHTNNANPSISPGVSESQKSLSSSLRTEIGPQSIESIPVSNEQEHLDDSGSAKPSREIIPESKSYRAKLDVASSQRMVFGSLGLRTPKTKEDASKLRAKLMKDVKPVSSKRAGENTEASCPGVAADDQGWKDKIDLRAVECCHDGVKLSTPPFPFVQRWDPQQQGGYNTNSARNRKKDKKRKRNTDYYHDNNAFDDSLDCTSPRKLPRPMEYVPPKGQAETKSADLSEFWGEAENESTCDVDLDDAQRAGRQLMREIDESTNTVPKLSKDQPDLPPLPADISKNPVLLKENCAPGTVIAFKMFAMSAQTNWQPTISEYRTALVDQFLDDGILQVTFAKRDQPSKQVQYDEITGDRIYGRFEMPGYEDVDEESDRGKTKIPFEELIEPILVQQAGQLSGQREHKDASKGLIDVGSGLIEHPEQKTSTLQQLSGFDGAFERQPSGLDSGLDRQEISNMIRDAGWRSSLLPEVNHDLDCEVPNAQNSWPAHVEPEDQSIRSTTIKSSPLLYGRSEMSSPSPTPVQSKHNIGNEIVESIPHHEVNEPVGPSVVSLERNTIEYPILPIDTGDDHSSHASTQHSFLSPHLSQQVSSQDIITPPPLRREREPSIASDKLASDPSKPSKSNAQAESPSSDDDGLPALFSQAFNNRLPQAREVKQENLQDSGLSAIPKRLPKAKTNGRLRSSQKGSEHGREAERLDQKVEEDSDPTWRPSQVQSTQIVDLTFSSDPIEDSEGVKDGDSSYRPSSSLPNGSGWINKARSKSSKPRAGGAAKKAQSK